MRYLVFIILLLLTGCGRQPNDQPSPNGESSVEPSAVIESGQKIAGETFQTLSRNLQRTIQEGGIDHALKFCNIEAMPLTDSLATRYGIVLRRASHQPRNPLNRADSLEMATIRHYIRQIEQEGELKPVVHIRSNSVTYHAPIRIPNQLCLNCHGKPGTDIAQSDFETIRELYPEDEATGFEMGELRGIWSIQFPPDHFNPQNN